MRVLGRKKKLVGGHQTPPPPARLGLNICLIRMNEMSLLSIFIKHCLDLVLLKIVSAVEKADTGKYFKIK